MAADFHGIVVTVAVPGTPVQFTAPASMTQGTRCHALVIEALSTNVGKVYIGRVGFTKVTGPGQVVVLPVPTTNLLATFSVSIAGAANGLNLGSLYVDADNAGDGVNVGIMVA